jgi:signal transduction histidine kinase
MRLWSSHPRAADLRAAVAGDTPMRVRIRPPLLAQLLDNLLENACKYCEAGTTIDVRAWIENASVALGVADQGQGLTADELPHIFEPFFRGEPARRAGLPGVGLGLAIAHRIATAVGGSLTVQSQPGAGSHFILRLPQVDAEHSPQDIGAGSSD